MASRLPARGHLRVRFARFTAYEWKTSLVNKISKFHVKHAAHFYRDTPRDWAAGGYAPAVGCRIENG